MKKEETERMPELIMCTEIPNKMHDIVLFGERNCGKSTTLHHLIVLLAGGGTLMPLIQVAYETCFAHSSSKELKDAAVYVDFRIDENTSVPIYVSTAGDSWQIVEDNFRFFYHCPRPLQNIYKFDGASFVKCDVTKEPFPLFCISPTNYIQFGGNQAHHYYLDMTCDDWKSNLWIRKKKEGSPTSLVKDYSILKVGRKDDQLALRIIDLLKQLHKESILF